VPSSCAAAPPIEQPSIHPRRSRSITAGQRRLPFVSRLADVAVQPGVMTCFKSRAGTTAAPLDGVFPVLIGVWRDWNALSLSGQQPMSMWPRPAVTLQRHQAAAFTASAGTELTIFRLVALDQEMHLRKLAAMRPSDTSARCPIGRLPPSSRSSPGLILCPRRWTRRHQRYRWHSAQQRRACRLTRARS